VDPFAAGGELDKGRVLVLADHSIFINGMMLQSDNDNFDFAVRCVNWLTDGGKRSRVLFIDEGEIVTDFTVPLQTVPDLPISPAQFVNELITGLEKENVFNKLILEQFPSNGLSKILSVVVLSLTIALVLFGFYRLAKSAHQVEAEVPLVSGHVAKVVPATAVVDQRREALLSEGNLWEAARDVARHGIAGLGLESRALTPPPIPPRISVAAGWSERRSLMAALARLWELAYGRQPTPISRRQFSRLLSDVNELKAAVEDGRMRFIGHRERA